MCRIFGFRSVINSQVHRSLVDADNALGGQSVSHPDGWGVAYYIGESPHIIKSEKSALDCRLFQRVSGIVSGQTVLAHIRKSTVGEKNILNTHPFQYANWVFAHNGNIKNFLKLKSDLILLVPPEMRRFILGDTDSEVLFFIILAALKREFSLEKRNLPIDEVILVIEKAILELTNVIGDFSQIDNNGPQETYLTFIISNGPIMVAHQGGKNLFYSTYKNRCFERDTCPSFSPECENVSTSGRINHLLLSSEPLQGENVWIPLKRTQLIGVDSAMKITTRLKSGA